MSAVPFLAVPGKFARRLAAVALLGQAMTVFFGGLVARQLSVADGDPDGRASTYLIGGCALAVLCVLASGLLRRPGGVLLGWAIQVLTLLSALVLPAMVAVAAIFAGLWWLCLSQGTKMDQMSAQWAADESPDSRGPQES
ncbi:MAG: DUF4233 domain-containing protein [Ornithinimicrobium sp.]